MMAVMTVMVDFMLMAFMKLTTKSIKVRIQHKVIFTTSLLARNSSESSRDKIHQYGGSRINEV